MREIKFRAWNDKRKRWVPWLEICLDGSYVAGEIEDSYSGLVPWEDQANTIEQFTGLLDKNGKEIYEGDIVKDVNKFCLEVRFGTWDNGEPYDMNDSGVGFYLYNDFGPHALTAECAEYEVIGNIHENPELLDSKGGAK